MPGGVQFDLIGRYADTLSGFNPGIKSYFTMDVRLAWKPRDIFVAPSWLPQSHIASSEAVLFSFSDRGVQQALGLWREQRTTP